jgi:hypothetical protein
MKVYHGSHLEIKTIDFSFCKKRRDFGRGFYVTKLLAQAEYWAARKGEDNDTDGVVTKFDFDEDAFEDEDLQTLRFDGYCDEWLDFIVLNRQNRKATQTHNYDIVEGPVADDDIATRVFDYVNKKISKRKFLQELTHKVPSHQICFCTLKSLQAITKVEKTDFAYNFKNISLDIIKTLVSERGLDKVDATDKFYNSDLFTKLANIDTKLYEKNWAEIYKMLEQELENNG